MTFACRTGRKAKLLTLCHAADTKIIRHNKIIGAANPYHPQYNDYFKKRSCERYL